MKKSVFTKYIWVFFIIILSSFTILSIIVASITIRTSENNKNNKSRIIGETLSKYFESEISRYVPYTTSLRQFIINNGGQVNALLNMSSFNNEVDYIVLVADQNGNILASSNWNGDKSLNGTKAMEHINDEMFYSYRDSLPDNSSNQYNIIVTPIRINPSGRAGVVLTCYNVQTITTFSYDVIKAIILTSMWVMIASFIIVYVLSEKITEPLKEMSVATKKLARGNFNSKLTVTGDDEISDLAKAFNIMASSLAELDFMRSNFLASVSHDLRTPMTTISGFIDGILSGAIPKEQQSYYLEIIKKEIQRLSRIVSDLLEISRLEAKSKKFEITKFDICEMLRIIILTFEKKIDDKQLEVNFNVPDKKIFINSDSDCIYRVIYNLCDNAVKFSKEKGELKIDLIENPNDVSITVYNEGIGIEESELSHVFERFYKTDKSRGMDKTGSGLGLYIAKSMLDSLDGEISVESEYGKYCAFTVILKKSVEKSN